MPPSIRGADGDLPDEVTVLVNKTTLLECQVDGSPTPKISWIKDSQPLTPDNTHRLLSNGRTLQVRRKSSVMQQCTVTHFFYIYVFIYVFCVTDFECTGDRYRTLCVCGSKLSWNSREIIQSPCAW